MTSAESPTESQPGRVRGGPLIAACAALLLYVIVPLISIGRTWGLTNYDDPFVASADNPAIGAGWSGFLSILPPWGEAFMHAWLPLYYGSLGLDHALFGDSFFWWHVHSAVLWALAAALTVLVARALGLRGFAPMTAGIILAVHPVGVESVAWIASRKEQLSLVWSLVAVLAYLRACERRNVVLHVVGCAALALALTAKASALVIPLLLALHALTVSEERGPRRVLPVVPYTLIALLMGIVHWSVAKAEGTVGAGTGATLLEILYADLEVTWLAARSLFIPWASWLSVEHDVTPFEVNGVRAALGAALVIGAAAVVWSNRRRPWVVLAVLALPIAYAPFNNLLPRTSVLFAERYLTIPLVVTALIAGALGARHLRRAAPFVAAALLGVLATTRMPAWEDAVKLWEAAERVSPTSALVQMQLADAYGAQARKPETPDPVGDLVRAESAWRAAREGARRDIETVTRARGETPFVLSVRKVQAETGLAGHLLATAGGHEDGVTRVSDAIAFLDSAERDLAALPDAPDRRDRLVLVLSNRGAAREALGDHEAALADWRRAARLDADGWLPMNAVARVQLLLRRPSEALAALAEARARAPDVPAAAAERARLMLAIGEPGAAKAELAPALSAHPKNADLLIASARLDLMLMRPLSAEEGFQKALAIRPADTALRNELAGALIQQAQAYAARDDVEGARDAARRAAAIAPGSSAPDQILGITARRRGDLDGAIQHFRHAHALQPDGVRIREALASVLAERAAQLLREERPAAAQLLLEESVATGSETLATPAVRLRYGVSGWPPLTASDGRGLVVRRAATAGLAFLAAGDPDRALLELRVADAGVEHADADLRRVIVPLLARAAYLSGDEAAAMEAIARLPQIADRHPGIERWEALDQQCEMSIEIGITRRSRGEREKSAEALTHARAVLGYAAEAGSPRGRAAQRRGEILFAEEDFLGATRAFDEAVEHAPANPDPLLNRAAVWRSLFALEQDTAYLDGSEEDLRQALSIAPSDGRIMAALGETLLLGQRAGEAFPWLSRAVLADPSQRSARAQLALLLVRAGRANLERRAETGDEEELQAAQDAADRAVALDAPDPGPLTLLGDVRRAAGDWDGAREAFETAVRLFPDRGAAHDALATFYRDLGHGYLLKGDERRAVQWFREALAEEGVEEADLAGIEDRLHGIAVGSFARGRDALRDKRPADAVGEFRLSVRAEETPETHYLLGVSLAASAAEDDVGSLREAADAGRRALELDSDLQPARLALADVLARLGKPGEAAAQLGEWLRRAEPDDELRLAVTKRRDVLMELEREIAAEIEKRLGDEPE